MAAGLARGPPDSPRSRALDCANDCQVYSWAKVSGDRPAEEKIP